MSIFSFLSKKIAIDFYPDAIIVLSKNYKIRNYNAYAERLLNLKARKKDELKPENLFDCDFSLLINELLGENNICTLKIKNSDTYVEIKASRKSENEIYFSLRDVTQKHKTVTSFMAEYETSKKINRTKNNLLIKLSNELLSPLHSITGFSQAMLEGLSGKIDAKQKKYLNVINKNAFELLDFLEKLIEGAKLETNSYEFEPKVFDAVNVVTAIANDVKEQNPSMKINTDFSELEKRTIYTDSEVFKKIIKYTVSDLIRTDYGEILIKLNSPSLEEVAAQGLVVEETSEPKNFLHVQITSNDDCPKSHAEINRFEIYPQLENNAKRELLENLPLYNASLLSKYLKIKLTCKTEGKCGYDIFMNIEKP